MTEDQDERLTQAWEGICVALKGLHEEAQRAGKRFWPEPREQRESVLTRVPNEEDEAKKNLGITNEPVSIDDWLELPEDDNRAIGERSRQWLKEHPEEVLAPEAVIEPGG